ncbi:lysine exporter LysO family protein [Parabacteroides sp. OttesenSCG-928-N08]|nr:lysine exporter LysO family protein [Parabacteroides sp. OttesenSCG-928-N08]
MFAVILIMFAGIGVGYLCRKRPLLPQIGRVITVTIFLMLFMLGLSVGSNEELMNNLPTLGGQALLLASAGTLGSVLAAWAVYRLLFQGRRKKER